MEALTGICKTGRLARRHNDGEFTVKTDFGFKGVGKYKEPLAEY